MLYYEAERRERVQVAAEIVLTDEERNELSKLVRSKRTSVRLAQRARIVLLAAEGMLSKNIAEQRGGGSGGCGFDHEAVLVLTRGLPVNRFAGRRNRWLDFLSANRAVCAPCPL